MSQFQPYALLVSGKLLVKQLHQRISRHWIAITRGSTVVRLHPPVCVAICEPRTLWQHTNDWSLRITWQIVGQLFPKASTLSKCSYHRSHPNQLRLTNYTVRCTCKLLLVLPRNTEHLIEKNDKLSSLDNVTPSSTNYATGVPMLHLFLKGPSSTFLPKKNVFSEPGGGIAWCSGLDW